MDEYCSTSVFCADGVRLIMTAANRKQPVAQHQHSRPAGIDLVGGSSDWAVQELLPQTEGNLHTLRDYL